MTIRETLHLCILVKMLTVALPLMAINAAAATRGRDLPPFERVAEMVHRHFLANQDPRSSSEASYKPNDLLPRSRVESVFAHLRIMGWNVKDNRSILGRVLGDHEFLVRHCQPSIALARQGKASPAARFLRKVSKHPLAYDRVQRITMLPSGRRFLVEAFERSDNQALVRFLETGKIDDSLEGAAEVKKVVRSATEGIDFDQPLGRIYTATQLVAALRTSYDRQSKAAKRDATTH
jgi:hypothetical protein